MQEYQGGKSDRIMMKSIKASLKNEYVLSVVSKIMTAVLGVFSSAFSTRYLGLINKGEYAYIVEISGILVALLNLGIYQSYSYNYKKYGSAILNKYINICFFQFAVLFLGATLVSFATHDVTITLIVFLVPFNILKMQYGNILLIEKIKVDLVYNIVHKVLTTLAYAVLFFFFNSNILYIVGVTITIDIIMVICYAASVRVLPHISHIDWKFAKEVIRFGIIPMMSAFLSTINYSIDIVFMKRMGNATELSLYSLATGLINYVWMVPDAFKSVLISKSARKFDRENILFSSQTSSSFIMLCFCGFLLLGKPLLHLVYGEDFMDSYTVTLILIIGAFPMSLYKITGVVLVSQGRRVAHFLTLCASAVVNVIMNIILIPIWGMYGAGFASVCSYCICGLGLAIYFSRLYKISIRELIIPGKEFYKIIKNRIHC